MNDEAEAWIVKWYSNGGDGLQSVADVIREAMRWAYADAAKVCRDIAESKYAHAQGNHLRDAVAIEKRAK